MKKSKSKINYRWIGILAGMLFSAQIISGQSQQDNFGSMLVRMELKWNDSGIVPGPDFYYLYGCNIPETDQQPDCIIFIESMDEFNEIQTRMLKEETDEEDIEIEPWMLNPNTWLTKQTAKDE